MDDIEYGDLAHERHMRKGSQRLANCIRRARAGLPTRSPAGLVPAVSMELPIRAWQAHEIATLSKMRDAGNSVAEISEALNRSRESVKDGIRRHLRGFDRLGRQAGGGM